MQEHDKLIREQNVSIYFKCKQKPHKKLIKSRFS